MYTLVLPFSLPLKHWVCISTQRIGVTDAVLKSSVFLLDPHGWGHCKDPKRTPTIYLLSVPSGSLVATQRGSWATPFRLVPVALQTPQQAMNQLGQPVPQVLMGTCYLAVCWIPCNSTTVLLAKDNIGNPACMYPFQVLLCFHFQVLSGAAQS